MSAGAPGAGDERLRKEERLRKRFEFLRAQREGARRAGPRFIVYARPNGLPYARLGITASRKTGKAHVRNWWKRRVREVFRRSKDVLPAGHDVVVIVKRGVSTPDDFDALRGELVELLNKAARAVERRRAP